MEDALSVTSLPDDPAALKSIIATLARQRDEASREREEEARRLKRRVDELEVAKLRLEMELLRLKKWYYGPRADHLQFRHGGDVAQMLLQFSAELESRAVDPADLPPDTPPSELVTVRRVRRGRRDLAAFQHLPVTRKVYDLGDDQRPCPCCGTPRERIGQESSWQVEYVPGRFERIEHVRVKYACRHCEHNADNPQIALAEKPAQPIDKGMAGPACWPTSSPASTPITCRCTGWSRSSPATAWRCPAPPRASGVGTRPTC